jgi:hypothetical protein
VVEDQIAATPGAKQHPKAPLLDFARREFSLLSCAFPSFNRANR